MDACLAISLVGLCVALGGDPPGLVTAEPWKMERIYLSHGEVLEGLVLSESPTEISFRWVQRRPGKRTLVQDLSLQSREVLRLERLPEQDRTALAAKLTELTRRAHIEAEQMKKLTLTRIKWAADTPGWQYQGPYFLLTSNAREDLVRRLVVRLQELFQAFDTALPRRRQPADQLHIVIYRTLPEYQAVLREQGLNILNPACFDPRRNQIAVASDIERLEEEWQRIRQQHAELLARIHKQEKLLQEHFGRKPPADLLAPLRQARQRIDLVNAQNRQVLERTAQRLHQTLYHEAFHAWLELYVYPSYERPVPRWLNEGLAQVFESAYVETGELHVGRIDPPRLAEARQALRKGQLVPLAELVRCGGQQFQVAHASEAHIADRYFLTSWALAHYLVFEKKLLATALMDRYLDSLSRGTDPEAALAHFANMPLHRLESALHEYLMNLKWD